MASRRYWRKKKTESEWTPEGRVSDEELLNRVILSKALIAHASGLTIQFRTGREVLEITPRSAEDVMRASGEYPRGKRKKSA